MLEMQARAQPRCRVFLTSLDGYVILAQDSSHAGCDQPCLPPLDTLTLTPGGAASLRGRLVVERIQCQAGEAISGLEVAVIGIPAWNPE